MSGVKECVNCNTLHGNVGDFCSTACERSFVKVVSFSSSVDVDGGGKRYNGNKLPMELIPTSSLYAIADCLGFGASKYELHNWRRGMKWSIPYACAMRHLMKWFDGEELDEESGKEHLSHVMTNIAMLIEYKRTCPELDDRYKGAARKYEDFIIKDDEDNSSSDGSSSSRSISEEELDLMADYYKSSL